MTKEDAIQKIVDYLLRNTDKMTSQGLFNGKAGLSISLFMAYGYLQDEQLEDKAYDLFQESLIAQTPDLSFESGLAGVGYALLYLIENKYVDADFDEIFAEQYERIIKINIEKDPLRLLNSMQLIYFLTKVSGIKKEEKRIGEMMQKIFEGLELFLAIQFCDFTDIQYINDKVAVLNIYKTYLKLIDYAGYPNFSRLVLEDYAALYRKGMIVSTVETGYYLNRLTEKYHIKGYEDVINDNKKFGIKNIFPSTLSLRERIDLAKLVNNEEIDLFSEFEHIKNDKIIKDLLNKVDEKTHPLGYGAGLGRFLIYCVDKNIELL